MKTKYATEAADAFRKMNKIKQPEKVWINDGAEFLGAFKRLCNSQAIHLYSIFCEKKYVFAKQNIRRLKNIIRRYLEEKLTSSYNDELDDCMKTRNSHVNRITKLAPNKFLMRINRKGDLGGFAIHDYHDQKLFILFKFSL